MRVYVLIISGAVPLLLWLSFCLVTARFLHDLLVARSRTAARATFAGVSIAGLAIAIFFAARTILLAGAIRNMADHDWPAADRALRRYARLGGAVDTALGLEWAEALMHEKRFREARQVLFSTAGRRQGRVALSRPAVLEIGECFYYEGNLREAEGALSVATHTDLGYLRSYLLGRIAERRGDFGAAHDHYAAALADSGEFFPAFYSITRLELIAGRRDQAAERLNAYRRRYPIAARNPLFPRLEQAARGEAAPPEAVEFYVVTA